LSPQYPVALLRGRFIGSYEDKNGKSFDFSLFSEMVTKDGSLKLAVTKDMNQIKVGTLEVFATNEAGSKINLNQGLTLFNTKVLHGVYLPKEGLSEDVYLTQDQQKVEYWTSKPLKGKVYKGKNIERPTYFIDMGSDNGQFFTFETWWFNEFKDGDEIIFDGKIREYNDVQKSGGIKTNKGIFDIKSTRKL
jgi:hypothetical protein